jgi:formamidopyrimidine-DNA glycosylase
VPELPDLTVYREALERRLVGKPLEGIKLVSPFVLRTVSPSPSALVGKRFTSISLIGKRIVFALEDELFAVIHLMISGRFRYLEKGKKPPGKLTLLAFEVPDGTLVLTEASKKKRASLHLVAGKEALAQFDRGGIDPLRASPAAFADALRRERHTLKRSLTDPRLFSGIGNAYSDEILHHAKLSPMQRTDHLTDEEITRLRASTESVLVKWTETLREEAGDAFPREVTAFRDGMAVHGRYGLPCPVCGSAVQRIVYAENEANYCARCQTGGKLLADRALSRLLKASWPKTIEELEGR